MMEREEELHILNAQRGDLAAFEKLVQQYDAKVMRLIFNMVSNLDDTRDLYQEVFIKAFQSLKSFRFQSEFYTWLFRIAVNTCINFRKRKKVRQHQAISSLQDDNAQNREIYNITSDENPEQHIIQEEFQIRVQQAIDQLSEQQRSVFILKHYHGFKLREIANLMGCSEGTVKNYLFRAIQKLRVSLQEYQSI